jgi:hypothetical protein
MDKILFRALLREKLSKVYAPYMVRGVLDLCMSYAEDEKSMKLMLEVIPRVEGCLMSLDWEIKPEYETIPQTTGNRPTN